MLQLHYLIRLSLLFDLLLRLSLLFFLLFLLYPLLLLEFFLLFEHPVSVLVVQRAPVPGFYVDVEEGWFVSVAIWAFATFNQETRLKLGKQRGSWMSETHAYLGTHLILSVKMSFLMRS